MTKEELIDKYLFESAQTVEQALVIARRIAVQHFGPCGNGEVVVHVAQLIMDNVPFVISMDEPELPAADLLPLTGTGEKTCENPTPPITAPTEPTIAPQPATELKEEPTPDAPAPTTAPAPAPAPKAKKSTEEAAPKAD